MQPFHSHFHKRLFFTATIMLIIHQWPLMLIFNWLLLINRDSSPLLRSMEPFHQPFTTAAPSPLILQIVMRRCHHHPHQHHHCVSFFLVGYFKACTIWQKQLCPRSSSSSSSDIRSDPIVVLIWPLLGRYQTRTICQKQSSPSDQWARRGEVPPL